VHFENALAVDPRHPASLYNLAHHERARGDAARARALYVSFLERGVYDTASRNEAIRALLELGAVDLAVAASLQVSPSDAESLSLAAEGLRRLGRDVLARDAAARALRLAPHNRSLNNNLAYLLATSSDPNVRDPALAIEIMRRLEAEAPLDAAERDTLQEAEAALR
jgi:Flp pilus assembly protein TadD